MKTDELREKYLSFFESKGHSPQPSDVLVPTWDPSVLFTPAGMNQFKDHFLGKVKLDFTRATTCQKCLRTGDIENVGRTAYHHTFFEMLGNFSFGDYFKRDAIFWAWEFLTDKKWLGIAAEQLSVSVYKDDTEAADIWHDEIGLAKNRIEWLDEDENFWPASAPSQGPDGVCGPCSEIFFHDEHGGAVEIWNLVFTQFQRVGDPPDNLRALPSKNIDTGMGLERTAATLQGVETNFHIDSLLPIVEAAAAVCEKEYVYDSEDGRRLRRITDHIRACAMAIHENVYPGAQKEKYVIRRLLRRAVLDGHQMGLREPFLHQLVSPVFEVMQRAYADVANSVDRVAKVVKSEEANFFGTIDAGLAHIEKIFEDMRSSGQQAVDGVQAADLYQTYGVPVEMFESMAAENNFAFDWDGYHRAMRDHGEASGKVSHAVMGIHGPIDAAKRVLHEVEFLGYDVLEADADLKFVIAQNQLCDHFQELGHASPAILILDRTPFYGESGGQVGDQGEIVGDGFRFQVTDTQKEGNLLLHSGHLLEGEIRPGCRVTARVDMQRRTGIRRAHSATHLLHHALHQHLGQHAQQQGSKVEQDSLRFDFSNPHALSAEQVQQLQSDVQEKIEQAASVTSRILPLAEARNCGAMMLFGEKYPDPVRMITIGDFSRELCGGTHLESTADVQCFEIVSEESVSAGTRRIVALTGEKAHQHREAASAVLSKLAEQLKVELKQVPAAVESLARYVRDLKKQVDRHEVKGTEWSVAGLASLDQSLPQLLHATAKVLNVGVSSVADRFETLCTERESLESRREEVGSREAVSAADMLEAAEDVAGVKLVVCDVPGGNANLLRTLIDQLRRESDAVAALLATRAAEDKVLLVAGLSDVLVGGGLDAGRWVTAAAKVVGGGGGGKPGMAQAGGRDATKIPEALETAREFAIAALDT
ncbi:MAG: alanine--tRNA ligase [Planctomycetota bacterium]|nr:alanine--tRNA ligase [Planctomycetota bacterium]